MDRGAWQSTVHGVAELDKTEATEHAHIYVSIPPQHQLNFTSKTLWESPICVASFMYNAIQTWFDTPMVIPDVSGRWPDSLPQINVKYRNMCNT